MIFKANVFFQAIHSKLFKVLLKFFMLLKPLLTHDFDYFKHSQIDLTNYDMLLHIIVQEFKLLLMNLKEYLD